MVVEAAIDQSPIRRTWSDKRVGLSVQEMGLIECAACVRVYATFPAQREPFPAPREESVHKTYDSLLVPLTCKQNREATI